MDNTDVEELYERIHTLQEENWKLKDKNKELENINDKLSSSLNSAEQRIDKIITILKGNINETI